MKCSACGKDLKIEDFFDHFWNYNERGGGTLKPDHEVPSEVRHRITSNKNEPCYFCGGKVAHHYFGSEGKVAHHYFGSEDDVGWSIECSVCGFLYDED